MSRKATPGGNRSGTTESTADWSSNIDPEQIGRVMCSARTCWERFPPVGRCPVFRPRAFRPACFIVPPIGSQVWVEFEQGDPDYPIWTGGFWGLVAEVPIFATAPPAIPPGQNIVLQTHADRTWCWSAMRPLRPSTGGIVLKSATGAMIVVNDTGIYISNGQGAIITLIGPAVDINLWRA